MFGGAPVYILQQQKVTRQSTVHHNHSELHFNFLATHNTLSSMTYGRIFTPFPFKINSSITRMLNVLFWPSSRSAVKGLFRVSQQHHQHPKNNKNKKNNDHCQHQA